LDVVTALQKVEGVIKADAVLKKSLQECKVPINLLDLLDHGNGLNPGKSDKCRTSTNVLYTIPPTGFSMSVNTCGSSFLRLILLLDCFSRGLLREALGQLAGLKRRKLALEMLGAAIQAGLDKQDAGRKGGNDVASSTVGAQKRKLEVEDKQSEQKKEQPAEAEHDEPAAKKMRTETI
jgi:hypothetical protein